ncbi:hypothetical protein AMELA_G00210910 [Ameiurus melas]|uniref:Uncharacterized protein n=1 Tax=Ameiurus melas TaxID=219545 RepID=A0A7J6A8B5_AMEME|nr:hypothetical protein AMELA_G00210910 [Ameiurus melas]
MKMLGCLVHAGSSVELTVTGRTPATISACSQPKTNQKAEHECSLDTPISHDPKHKPASMLTNDGLLTLDKISIVSGMNSVSDRVVKHEMKIV